MNTYDEIELPPLPPDLKSLEFSSQTLEVIREWGISAIALDRQGRGEPVGWQAVDHSGYRPQPAAPVVKESLTVAEPVKVPTDEDLSMLFGMWGWRTKDGRELRFEHFKEMVQILLAKYGQPAQPAASAEPVTGNASAALRFAAQVVELYDDATMDNDYMIDSGDCAGILNALADYYSRYGQPAQPMVDMAPPATSRDRWMYEQGRLAERDPRTEGSLAAQVAAQPSVPDGFRLIAVNSAFDDLMYWLDRCEDKGHLENCADLIEPWQAFEYRELPTPPAAMQQERQP